jgi:hypothetical protein
VLYNYVSNSVTAALVRKRALALSDVSQILDIFIQEYELENFKTPAPAVHQVAKRSIRILASDHLRGFAPAPLAPPPPPHSRTVAGAADDGSGDAHELREGGGGAGGGVIEEFLRAVAVGQRLIDIGPTFSKVCSMVALYSEILGH